MISDTIILEIPLSRRDVDWFTFVNNSILLVHEEYNHIIVDFSSITFLFTDDFVVLACLIETLHNKNDFCKVSFIGGTVGFNAHLENIKFKKYWEIGFNRERFTVSLNRSTLCLWKISREMIESYSSYAKDYFKNTFFNDKDLVPLASNLKEVFNNIFDHAQSPISGYIITQYFPKKKQLSFAVCDFGRGIPNSINTYLENENKPKIEDYLALFKSLEQGFSIKSIPNNRGFGLNNILEFTESSNGELMIISNNGTLVKKANQNYSVGTSEYHFKGTLIKVIVDTNTFDIMDEDDLIYEF